MASRVVQQLGNYFIYLNSAVTFHRDPFQETDIEIKEEFDNPSHGIAIKCLNKNLKSASNDLMVNQQPLIKTHQKHIRRQSSNLVVTLKSSVIVGNK